MPVPLLGEGQEEEEGEADQSIWRAAACVPNETCSRMKYSHDRGRQWVVGWGVCGGGEGRGGEEGVGLAPPGDVVPINTQDGSLLSRR